MDERISSKARQVIAALSLLILRQCLNLHAYIENRRTVSKEKYMNYKIYTKKERNRQ
jgi:hypothetical protein